MSLPDWTSGGAGLVVQRCASCGATWYFARSLCPRCGTDSPESRPSTGAGTVVAVTVVHRAPSDEWRPFAPYTLALVDLEEGVRVMGHAEPGVAIGDRVVVRFDRRAERVVPVFEVRR